jgi:hypothetical protein
MTESSGDDTPRKECARPLDRPIFLVGHARAGSTLLASILAEHPDIGPKPQSAGRDRAHNLEELLQFGVHLHYASQFEQKDVWFAHCGGQDVFTHMGLELVRDDKFAPKVDANLLRHELTRNFNERRFLSKAPTNTFRIKLIAELFPGARFLVIYRKGEEVVGSWGRRPYGFGRRVDWGELRTYRLGYKRGIDIFARKWEETIAYAESCRNSVSMMRLTYNQLTTNTEETLERVTSFLELDSPLRAPGTLARDRDIAWKRVIPFWWRPYLRSRTKHGNSILQRIEHEVAQAR